MRHRTRRLSARLGALALAAALAAAGCGFRPVEYPDLEPYDLEQDPINLEAGDPTPPPAVIPRLQGSGR